MKERFLRKIDLECSELRVKVIEVEAYQLDNKGRGDNIQHGLKKEVKLDGIKSCDYFLEKENKIYLIEISDFFSQFELIKLTYQKIIDCNKLNRADRRLINKHSPERILKAEIKNKYLNTLLILSYANLIDGITQRSFILALCNFEQEIVMIFDRLKREIKNDLKILVDEVEIIPAEALEQYLKQINV